MILELPDYLLLPCHLEETGLLSDMSMTQIIANNRAPVRESLTSGHQSQWIPRQVEEAENGVISVRRRSKGSALAFKRPLKA